MSKFNSHTRCELTAVMTENQIVGAFTIQQGMKKLQKEFNNENNVIIDTRKMIPENIEQLKKAIDDAGVANRIIWYP